MLWTSTGMTASRLSFLPESSKSDAVTEELSDPIHPMDESDVRIYLTFDDGPSAESTPAILEILDSYGAKATFFVVGYYAEDMPDMVRTVAAQGHLIANHSFTHDYDKIYSSADAFMSDIEYNENALTAILGYTPPRILRFPAGSAASQLDDDPGMREEIKAALQAGGWRYFDWDVSMGDSVIGWTPAPGELGSKLIEAIDEQVAYGATDIVVLAHDVDAKPWTPIDLPMVIEHGRAQGFAFRSLSLDSPIVEYR